MPVIPGLPYPLGATLRDAGVNFAVASEHATAVELCWFDEAGVERCEPLPGREHGIWHGFLPGATAGLRYGFRAHGPYAPERGLRFNPNKRLLDPYAREIVDRFVWDDAHYGHVLGHPAGDCSYDPRDNAAQMLTARVAAPLPEDTGPRSTGVRVPAADTVIYELHVKGFSMLHPGVPAPLRGTYAGLGHPACVEHLRELGVTTLSLMPVFYALSERRLVELGLTNYWGYNPIAWFCPDPRLSSTPDDPTATRAEFRAMVAALHGAGLEVVLDVVYNHSAEADERGPTLSLRGLDDGLYYRRELGEPRRHVNWTGCGNTLNTHEPRVTQLVLDSLRYWVEEFGVDGFRFDLAPVLGRTHTDFDPRAPLFVALAQDPVLARVKLIAEPWDLGPEGYRLGGFPRRWSEWNDRYRDAMRRFWLIGDVDRAEFARRLAGSSDCFAPETRAPTASVNFITAHDGFTLADLVSYRRKHNLENGEDNRDGHSHNFSVNCGVEGPTDDPAVLARRRALGEALLTTLLVSQGTPMLLAGDELGRSQRGNNNAYCQDNAISWIDWANVDEQRLEFVRRLIALRRQHPALRQDRWLGPHPHEGGGRPVHWRRPDGAPMDVHDWHDRRERALMVELGEPDDALLLLFNPEPTAAWFRLVAEGPWTPALGAEHLSRATDEQVRVAAHAVVVLARA
jgi:isoamylase